MNALRHDEDTHQEEGEPPFLHHDQSLNGKRMFDLLKTLEDGSEVKVKQLGTEGSSYVAASRLRDTLGPEYVVTVGGAAVYARKKRDGELDHTILGPMGEEDPRDWLGMAEAAVAAGVSTTTISLWVNKGLIEGRKFGRRSLINAQSVHDLVERRRAAKNPT